MDNKSRLDKVLDMEDVAPDARAELIDGKKAVKDIEHISQVAESEGGKVLLGILKEECRDHLVSMLNNRKEAKPEAVLMFLDKFEASFSLYNAIKTASADYQEAEQNLSDRLDEILEG